MYNVKKKFLCIQNIVFNYREEVEKLFVHVAETKKNSKIYSTDTYFNIFHYTRWHDLTGCDKFFLHLFCRGKGKLDLFGIHANPKDSPQTKGICIPEHITARYVKSYKIYKQLSIDIDGGYDFYFITWENLDGECLDIKKAYYAIHSECCKRNVNIAIISVTYNRMKDIDCLAKTYMSACLHNSYFNNFSHLYIVNNEYLNKKFLIRYEQKNITIINNKENYGGSGGFAQGARLAVEDGGFTHVLFMDDDALIHEESWFRTIALLRCLRDDLYGHPISGTMFTREQPTYCHAAIEGLNKHLHRICLSGASFLDKAETCSAFLTSAHEICRQLLCTEGQFPYSYAAWWYCLFPIKVFVQHGYPAPYFFCGDDIELGLRIKKNTLFLNGICVWHPNFKNKGSLFREYLSFRNYALRCIVHMKGWRYELIKTFFRKIIRCLAANDYELGAITILAIRDFLEFTNIPRAGSLLISRVETERQRWINKKEICSSRPVYIKEKSLNNNLLPMFLVFFTFGGVLIPTFLLRNYTVAPFHQVGGRWASQWTAYSNEDYFKMFDKEKAFQIYLKSISLIFKILTKRDNNEYTFI